MSTIEARADVAPERLSWQQVCERFPDEWVGWGIDGLIGLSFLRLLNYEIRSREGRILVERAE